MNNQRYMRHKATNRCKFPPRKQRDHLKMPVQLSKYEGENFIQRFSVYYNHQCSTLGIHIPVISIILFDSQRDMTPQHQSALFPFICIHPHSYRSMVPENASNCRVNKPWLKVMTVFLSPKIWITILYCIQPCPVPQDSGRTHSLYNLPHESGRIGDVISVWSVCPNPVRVMTVSMITDMELPFKFGYTVLTP